MLEKGATVALTCTVRERARGFRQHLRRGFLEDVRYLKKIDKTFYFFII